MKLGRRIHDGVVGGVILVGLLLSQFNDSAWLWLVMLLGIILLQSAFTGFCPVYFILDKFIDDVSCEDQV